MVIYCLEQILEFTKRIVKYDGWSFEIKTSEDGNKDYLVIFKKKFLVEEVYAGQGNDLANAMSQAYYQAITAERRRNFKGNGLF